jgi:hypothetical protein
MEEASTALEVVAVNAGMVRDQGLSDDETCA